MKPFLFSSNYGMCDPGLKGHRKCSKSHARRTLLLVEGLGEKVYASELSRSCAQTFVCSTGLEAERKEGKSPEEAIFEGRMQRFRPIMMTTIAALPVAFGTGAGGEYHTRDLSVSGPLHAQARSK